MRCLNPSCELAASWVLACGEITFFKPPLNSSSNRAAVSAETGLEQGASRAIKHAAILWNTFHQEWFYLKHILHDYAYTRNAQEMLSVKIPLACCVKGLASTGEPTPPFWTGWRCPNWGQGVPDQCHCHQQGRKTSPRQQEMWSVAASLALRLQWPTHPSNLWPPSQDLPPVRATAPRMHQPAFPVSISF